MKFFATVMSPSSSTTARLTFTCQALGAQLEGRMALSTSHYQSGAIVLDGDGDEWAKTKRKA